MTHRKLMSVEILNMKEISHHLPNSRIAKPPEKVNYEKNFQPEGNLSTPDAITMHNPIFHEHP
jgi:hypothetical protein